MEKFRKIMGNIFLLIALLTLLYPFISEYNLSKMNVQISNQIYGNHLEKSEVEKREKAKEDYNKSLLAGSFNASGEVVNLKLPKQQLLTGELSPIGVLYVPKLNEDIPIYMGTTEDILDIGVGIVENTSIPGTLGSNSVISGHRGTHNASIFKDLDKMSKGDPVYVVMNNKVLKYKAKEIKIVQPDDVSSLNLDPDKDVVTLLTCTPYLINTERLLVICDRDEMTKQDREMFVKKFSVNANFKSVEDLKKKAAKSTAIELVISGFIIEGLIILIIILKKKYKEIK